MLRDLSFLNKITIEDEVAYAKDILHRLIEEVSADFACIYFVSISTGKLKLFCYVMRENALYNIDEYIEMSTVIKDNNAINESYKNSHKLVFPLIRHNDCLGFLEIRKHEIISESNKLIHRLENLSYLFIILYERRFINNMLKKIQEPIDFAAASKDEFMEDIMNTIEIASGMQLIALRELTEDSELKCLGVRGFDNTERESFDFSSNAFPDEFMDVINNNKWHFEFNAQQISWVKNNPLLKDVASFLALPIRVGSSIFGVLSFATKIRHYFTNTEILALESIANGIGVAITNYRNFNSSIIDMTNYSEAAVKLTGLEIAQATRHEAKGKLDVIQMDIANLQKSLQKATKDEINLELSEISSKLLSIKNVLEKIKTATKPPKRIKSEESLKGIWNQAVSALSGRLKQLDIDTRYIGKEPVIEVYPEWLRHVFLNLLLNSIDAFHRGSQKKRGRQISLTIDKYPDDFDHVSMVYSDNAGGIDPSSLYIPDNVKESERGDLNQCLFLPNVTSKLSWGDNDKGKSDTIEVEGSGWGLFLVRQCIGYHGGSINLIRYKGGVSFRIDLHRRLPDQESKRGGLK